LMIWGILAAPAAAGSFQVNPVNITIPADRQSTAVTMKNNDSTPVSVRVVAYRWSQENGRDVYSPTGDVIASPAIFTIPPGAGQLVRVGLRTRGATAYRVMFEEIPRPQANGAVQVTLRLNLPLYLPPSPTAKPDVSWKISRNAAGEMVISGRNSGTAHAQMLAFEAEDQAGHRISLSQEMGVVLPASTRNWKAGVHPEFTVGSSLLLKVRNPTGVSQTQIVVE
jgi:fimbrial chaperone protein